MQKYAWVIPVAISLLIAVLALTQSYGADGQVLKDVVKKTEACHEDRKQIRAEIITSNRTISESLHKQALTLAALEAKLGMLLQYEEDRRRIERGRQ
jgi:hypothetical protein